MFVLLVVFLTSTTCYVEAFFVGSSSLCRKLPKATATAKLASGSASETNAVKEDDDYDDFFNDFNPADFEQYNSNDRVDDDNRRRNDRVDDNRSRYSRVDSNRGRSDRTDSNRGRNDRTDSNRGRTTNDYTRDLDADDSNVDLDVINALLADRTYKRQTGQFADADRIRDQLLDEHGVMCRDKDAVWRSGCSRSGSGQKWLSAIDKSKGRPDLSRGANGHDYQLSSDAGPNASQMSDDEIHQLLAERLGYKFKRNYNRADDIQSKLLSAGVFVSDSKKEWRADGKGFSSFNPSRYEISPDSEESVDPSTMEGIKALIDERAVAKVERLYKRADEIRNELLAKYNVVVDDRSLTFSVGGKYGVENKWGKSYVAYTMSRGSAVPTDADEIQQMVEQRDVARVERDFQKADEIRNTLSDRNIFIDDKNREWYVGSDDDEGGERIRNPSQRVERVLAPYARTGGGDLSDVELELVVKLIGERDVYKQKRQYEQADEIRTELADVYGVKVDDRNREWHVETNDYFMASDSAPIDEETKNIIEQMIRERSQAREERNFDAADEIRFDLVENYSVTLDDRVKEWWISPDGAPGNVQTTKKPY